MRDLARLQCGYLQRLATDILAQYDAARAAAAAADSAAGTMHGHKVAGAGDGGNIDAGAEDAGKKRKRRREADKSAGGRENTGAAEGQVGGSNGVFVANDLSPLRAAVDLSQLQVATSAALCAMLELDYR